MKKKTIETITLEVMEDNPAWSLCPGHVNAKTFNKAYEAEGWEGDTVTKDDLKYEYWKRTRTGYRKVEAGTKGAKPFTVMEW